jgi:ubiquinol-cytochrome c reductase cytochrome b subunit
MNTDSAKPWVETRLPMIAAWRARFKEPVRLPDAPYLATLPTIITAALVFMSISGFVLAVYYRPYQAFGSLQFIDRDVNNGWLIRTFHETGTTMIFGAVYLALFNRMSTRSYRAPGEMLWLLGVVQFMLLLLIGYTGYLLTDGAVSYWSLHDAATTAQMLGGAPGAIGTWFFGGPDGAGTLARMEVFHAVMALAVFGIIALHYAARRVSSAGMPASRRVAFHPYYTAQYFVAFVMFALIFAALAFFAPHLGDNPLNAAPASPLLVPAVALPPWYLLPIGAASQVFPGTWGGILAVIAGFAVLLALPWLDRSKPGARPGGRYRLLVTVLALDVAALGVVAHAGPSAIGNILTIVFTGWYFLHFLVLTPLVTGMESE